MGELTRRSLLKGAAATGVAGATGALSTAALTTVAHAAVPKELDIAIIGAGVSGAYVGWSALARDPDGKRLSAGGRPKVAIFEMGDRIGGRLWSTVPPEAPHLRAESGGMRYLPRQQLVFSLIEHLRVASRPFLMGGGENLFYLRGKRFTQRDLEAGKPVAPYKLSAGYKGLTPDDVFYKAIERYVPNAKKMTVAQWQAAKRVLKYGGRPGYEVGMDNLLELALKGDDRQFAIDGSGYLSDYAHVNAADDVQRMYMGYVDPQYRTLVDGYQALPLTLARKFTEAGGHLEKNARLMRIDRTRDNGKDLMVLHFRGADGPYTVRARHVVLAMPWRSLDMLDKASFMFADKGFVQDMGAVIPIPAVKMYLAYEKNWWRKLGLSSGRSLTDLPLRQCLYFGTEKDAPGGEPGNDRSLLSATYADMEMAGYWRRHQTRSSGPYPSRGGVPAGQECSAAAVADIQSQLSLLHGVAVPAPYWATLQDWSKDPYGGGWHFWKVGRKSWEVMPRIRRPVAGAPLYICGEAYSDAQGWVEGALRTAEHVLRDQLGLTRPSWMPADAVLGP